MPRTKRPAFTRPELPPLGRVDPERLRQARKKAGLNQDDLSYLTGVSTRTLSRLETGTHEGSPSVGDVFRIARVLSVSLDWLVTEPK
jgi:transcriptional regulator with XRE-family HTH domain